MSKYTILKGELLGGKAQQLVKLAEAGFNVPSFQVIPAEYQHSLDAHKEYILGQCLGTKKLLSVRSSAMGEDGSQHSFAGQFDSHLFVKPEEVIHFIEKVYSSAKGERIGAYMQQNQIEGEVRMAVIIQEMIHADVSGVMFGQHPVTQREGEMLISAVYGVGEGLVSGALNSDDYTVYKEEITKHIAAKNEMMTISADGTGTALLPVEEAKWKEPALNNMQVSRLFSLLTQLNDLYGEPQDVEWAIKDDIIYILQSRPITNLKSGDRIIWDNSNIIESYPGVTTPLTFSFIRDMYRVVYEQFSALLGIEEKVLRENADVYENMLGLLRGRVYYNLRSWYRALALLPGYKLNAGFMETMMGVKEKFELEDAHKVSKTRARWMILKTVFRMIRTFRKLPKERDKFLDFLDITVKKYQRIDFDTCTPEELMKHYLTFEHILTEKWDPPLVNDFFAMIYFGIFQKLIAKWIGTEHPHLHNDLLASSNDIISVEPMRRSLTLAQEIRKEPSVLEQFQGSPEEVWTRIQGSEIHQKILDYLAKFGERCLGELKLETISYTQAPEKYVKILQSYIRNPKAMEALDRSKSKELRASARKIANSSLKGRPMKRLIFNYFLRKTRELVSNRENLRFERTRGFGVVRTIFSAMGVQFENREIIKHHRDIFFLTKEEIFDYIKGTAISTRFHELIELRKKEYADYEQDTYVPERIITRGAANEGLKFVNHEGRLSAEEGDLTGIACCPGVVKAEVCVVHSPDQIDDLQGRIMVTTSTDPGWVSLFPTAAGILVERGSLLSHSAIVARELGIPCIVAINGLLSSLKTGEMVEMDGSSGVIKRLDHG